MNFINLTATFTLVLTRQFDTFYDCELDEGRLIEGSTLTYRNHHRRDLVFPFVLLDGVVRVVEPLVRKRLDPQT